MDKPVKNVHNSGALGSLLRAGQIRKVESEDMNKEDTSVVSSVEGMRVSPASFSTESGIQFNENDLVYLDPNECEPWIYANRHSSEMGDIDELINSIQNNKQLQPGLVRLHPKPHNGFKYEIIFGRRRHEACLRLGIKFYAIRKLNLDLHEAILSQDAENKFRKDVSNYSNAFLYKRLLDDKVFKNEKELALKLRIPSSSFNDLMSYTKIPEDIAINISNIHSLSINMALKINYLISADIRNADILRSLATKIGSSITSPAKLENELNNILQKKNPHPNTKAVFKDDDGHNLFTYKTDKSGKPIFIVDVSIIKTLDVEKLCSELKSLIISLKMRFLETEAK
jgi:ParB family chromosome partitioning protein